PAASRPTPGTPPASPPPPAVRAASATPSSTPRALPAIASAPLGRTSPAPPQAGGGGARPDRVAGRRYASGSFPSLSNQRPLVIIADYQCQERFPPQSEKIPLRPRGRRGQGEVGDAAWRTPSKQGSRKEEPPQRQ